MKLDPKDRTIITMYARDPQISQDDIARKIGLSQPSVAVRIRKLRENGAIVTQTGINPLKMGLSMAKVDIATTNTLLLLNMFRNCPFFANGFTVSGKHNLSMLFVGENIATLEAIVNNHIRAHESVTDVDFNLFIDAEKDFIVPVELTTDVLDVPPCGIHLDCRDCPSFSRKCTGCPATGKHRGWLF